MAVRTGEQYLEGLRDDRAVYLDGNRVPDVTKAPGLGEMTATVARLYDLHHKPEFEDLLTFVTDRGERRSRAWMLPKTRQELAERQVYTQTLGRLTGGLFGRLPEYVPLFHVGMVDVADAFAEGREDFRQNIHTYFERVASEDLSLSHAFVDLQCDPSLDLDETPLLRVMKETDSGLVVNGVKSIGTFVGQSDECLIGTFPRPGLKPHHVVYFSIPVFAQGVKVVARAPNLAGANEFDHPVSRFGDENDAIIVLDNVEIPWERVFQFGVDPGFAARTFPLITEWAHWSILCRLATKAEVLVGLYADLPRMLGRHKRPDALEWLGEVERYLITLRSFIDSASVRGRETESGLFMPDPDIVTAGRCYSVEHYRRIISGLLDIMGQGFINAPTEGTLRSAAIGDAMQEMFSGPQIDAFERIRLTRLAMDIAVDGFGGRQTLFEIFNATGTAQIRAQLTARFQTEPYRHLARSVAGLSDLDRAARAMLDVRGADTGHDVYDAVGDAYQTRYSPTGT